mmetsp:Transcript_41037/g.112988  ORF Transcript_41037/g.112988 Transcript_41037/m.112988 type:complete len:304 (+) Transcript_41037:732-1643(+)
MTPVDPVALDTNRVREPAFHHPVGTPDAAVVKRVVLLLALEAAPLEVWQRRARQDHARPVFHMKRDSRPAHAASAHVPLPIARAVADIERTVWLPLGAALLPLKRLLVKNLHRNTALVVDLCFGQDLAWLVWEGCRKGYQDSSDVIGVAAAPEQQVRLVEDYGLHVANAGDRLPPCQLVVRNTRQKTLGGGSRRGDEYVGHVFGPTAPRGIHGDLPPDDFRGDLLGNHLHLESELTTWYEDQGNRRGAILRPRLGTQCQFEGWQQIGKRLAGASLGVDDHGTAVLRKDHRDRGSLHAGGPHET